ncbi:MAG: hypothetical protein HeimC2_42290 [Candidatus Heimdallarchaeota archaeon LC_2]|nr:MAG: hypothetical protein HeimC2_42290 [Candidatus Heimdallarchaeota archaeon LC_2]
MEISIEMNTWTPELSKKLELLNYLEPIIALRKLPFSEPDLRMMRDRYDILSLVLIMIQEIINSFSIDSEIGLGLTRDDIMNRLIPFMEKIDQRDGIIVNSELHVQFISKLITKLTSKNYQEHKITFIDYQDGNFLQRDRILTILKAELGPEGIVVIKIDEKLINIFRSLANEDSIENEVTAQRYMLSTQVAKGELSNAINSAKRQVSSARAYLVKIHNTIRSLERNYDEKKWREVQRVDLKRIEEQVEQWIKDHNDIYDLVGIHFGSVPYNDPNYKKIQSLEKRIMDANSYFTSIYSTVSAARQTFLSVHWNRRRFTTSDDILFSLDPELVQAIARTTLAEQPNVMNLLEGYLQIPRAPRIHSILNTLDYLTATGRTYFDPKPIENLELTFSEEISKFDEQVKLDAWTAFYEFINNQNQFMLSSLFNFMKESGNSYTSIVFLCYFFMIRAGEEAKIGYQHDKVYIINSTLNNLFHFEYRENVVIGGGDLLIKVEEVDGN